MNNLWFTADTHFGHKNILKYCPETRPFDSVTTMTEMLIEKWNSQVKNEDVVYHLGDLSFLKADETSKIIRQLKGKLVLIKGNHDYVWMDASTTRRFIVYDYLKIKIGQRRVSLFHYPITEWDQMHYGSYALFGHVHGRLNPVGRTMDVGVDTRPGCGLWHWDEIDQLLKDKPILPHH